ncbi:hypothetical protein C8R47DRAFT_1296757 [Mycena vitilis]|nr:hypothetical protein C8R47DRAFT_1296757 [Mycena vitilis]
MRMQWPSSPSVPAGGPELLLPEGASLWRRLKWKLVDSQGVLSAQADAFGFPCSRPHCGFCCETTDNDVVPKEIQRLSHPWLLHLYGGLRRPERSSDCQRMMTIQSTMGPTSLVPRCLKTATRRRHEPPTLPCESPLSRRELNLNGLKAKRSKPSAQQQRHPFKQKQGFCILQRHRFLPGRWFVVRCIARTAQHLPLTELEVATLAFAVVNLVIWLLWWSKPLDVRDPTIVTAQDLSAADEPEDETPPKEKPGWKTWLTKFGGILGVDYYYRCANILVFLERTLSGSTCTATSSSSCTCSANLALPRYLGHSTVQPGTRPFRPLRKCGHGGSRRSCLLLTPSIFIGAVLLVELLEWQAGWSWCQVGVNGREKLTAGSGPEFEDGEFFLQRVNKAIKIFAKVHE